MRLLKAFAILASALFLFGCDDGDENGSDLPEPTGSGYLTGKWSGSLAFANGGGGGSISYSYYPQHWILSHEGSQVSMVSYTVEHGDVDHVSAARPGRVVAGSGGTGRLVFDAGGNLRAIDLIIGADRNTLVNSRTYNGKSGGQLVRE